MKDFQSALYHSIGKTLVAVIWKYPPKIQFQSDLFSQIASESSSVMDENDAEWPTKLTGRRTGFLKKNKWGKLCRLWEHRKVCFRASYVICKIEVPLVNRAGMRQFSKLCEYSQLNLLESSLRSIWRLHPPVITWLILHCTFLSNGKNNLSLRRSIGAGKT